jgi:hypothetical protein
MSPAVETWERLLGPEGAGLRTEIVGDAPIEPATLARWRRAWPRDLVDAAIELARARAAAAARFPDADRLVADRAGVEQATSHVVATHKAARFAGLDADDRPVLDLCCGIGGDTMALARVTEVVGVDESPLRAWMAGRNAGCATRTANVETLTDLAGVVHLDPARRDEGDGGTGGRRRWRYEDYRPGPAFIARVLDDATDAAIKLGPGVDLAALPLDPGREIEIIAERGTLVQAVLWSGRLARHPGARTATRLPEGRSFTGTPVPPPEGDSAIGRFLLVPHPAVERADLTGAVCAALGAGGPARDVHPGLGLLTADAPVDSPWLDAHEVLAVMPWRPPRVRAWLAARHAGIITVRTRGGAVDTDHAQRALRGPGDETMTVFVLRLGVKVVAVATREA